MNWHIGCSGFQYRHWRGVFYPEKLAQKNWFLYYSEHFKTVELNVTFYRFPDLKMVKAWYEKSASDFIFTIKAPRLITHYKKFNDTDDLIKQFYDIISSGLKEKLGCVLFQFPPKYSFTMERLEKIVASMDPSFTNVIEFRNNSWWNQKVYKTLGEGNISFCGTSHPLLPTDIIHNASVLYYRLHGIPELYKSPYEFEQLKQLQESIRRLRKVTDSYIYFNNDIDGSAVKNVKELLMLVDPS